MTSQILNEAAKLIVPALIIPIIAYDTCQAVTGNDQQDNLNQENASASALISASASPSDGKEASAISSAPVNNTRTFTQNFDSINLTIQETTLFFTGHKIRLTVTHSPLGKMNNFSVTKHKWSAESSRGECFTEITNKVDEVYGCCCKFFYKYFCCCC